MATPTFGSSIIAELSARYRFRDPEEVVGYLREHPYLVPLLHEVGDQIARYFGPGAEVALQVVVDREAEEQRDLFALIGTDLPIVEAKRRLDELDAGWWLEALDQARCNLTIDVERSVAGGEV